MHKKPISYSNLPRNAVAGAIDRRARAQRYAYAADRFAREIIGFLKVVGGALAAAHLFVKPLTLQILADILQL